MQRLAAALSDRYTIERELGAGETIVVLNLFDELRARRTR